MCELKIAYICTCNAKRDRHVNETWHTIKALLKQQAGNGAFLMYSDRYMGQSLQLSRLIGNARNGTTMHRTMYLEGIYNHEQRGMQTFSLVLKISGCTVAKSILSGQ